MTWPQALGISLALWAAEAAATTDPCSARSVVAALQTGAFTRIARVSDLPGGVLSEFWRAIPTHASEPRSLADPGSEFQATDVISTPPLPWRRLIFGGRSPGVTFLYYEKGGYALTRHLFVVCSQGVSAGSFSYLSPRKAEDARDLLRGLVVGCLVAPPREYLEGSEIDRCL